MVPQLTRSKKGDPPRVPLLQFYCASEWHEDVPISPSLVLLERNEAIRWRFCSTMSHVLAGKG